MPLKLEWLYYFVVLAESESFNIAADRLCISQQALSKHLAQIENKLGGQLVQRSQRFEKLTPAGELLLQKARRILAHAETLENLFLPVAGTEKAPPLRLAVAPFLEPRLVECLRQLISERSSLIQPQLIRSLSAAEIAQQLEQGQLDLALLPYAPTPHRLQQQVFSVSPYVIVSAPGQTVRDWRKLSFIRLLGTESSPSLDAWPETEWPRRIIAEADYETALALCMRGSGALLLPQCLVDSKLQNRQLKLGPVTPFELSYRSYLVWSDSLRKQPERADWLQRLLKLAGPSLVAVGDKKT